jgi:hypothetical protein
MTVTGKLRMALGIALLLVGRVSADVKEVRLAVKGAT